MKINDIKKARKEITDLFITCHHWNTKVRKPEEKEVLPDPDGLLARIADTCDMILQRENMSLPAKYLCLDGTWRKCVVVPRPDNTPNGYTAIKANGVIHLALNHDIQF